jgi:hypothetical protein
MRSRRLEHGHPADPPSFSRSASASFRPTNSRASCQRRLTVLTDIPSDLPIASRSRPRYYVSVNTSDAAPNPAGTKLGAASRHWRPGIPTDQGQRVGFQMIEGFVDSEGRALCNRFLSRPF